MNSKSCTLNLTPEPYAVRFWQTLSPKSQTSYTLAPYRVEIKIDDPSKKECLQP